MTKLAPNWMPVLGRIGKQSLTGEEIMRHEITLRELRRAEDTERLEQAGNRIVPTWKTFLRSKSPGKRDTEIYRAIFRREVFELAAGGPEALRRQTIAAVYQLASRAIDLLEDRDFPEAA